MEQNRGGRPRIDEHWEIRIGELAEDKDEAGKHLTAGEIFRRVLDEAKRSKRSDYPRLQTIKARLAKRRTVEPVIRALDAPFPEPAEAWQGMWSDGGSQWRN